MAIDIRNIKTAVQPRTGVRERKPFNRAFDFLNKDFSLSGPGLKDGRKESFYSELSVLLSSGVDIRTALEIVVEEQTQPSLKQLYNNVYEKIIRGESLSDALYQTKKFSLFEYYNLQIGEESGRIRDILSDLSVYFTKKIRQRRQLTNAFTYPALVVVTAFIAVFFMLKFIVPMFTDVFARFQGELPSLTRFIIGISGSFSRHVGMIMLIVLVSGILLFSFRKNTFYRKYSSCFVLKIPLLGGIVNKIYLARFCQSMALLLGSKTPMLKSIRMVRKMIGFYPFEIALDTMERDVLHGKLLNQSMQQFPVFEKRLLSLTRIAEETNQLDKLYTKLNVQYTEELEHRIGIIGSIIEPAMIIVVGLLVAVILISMYLPLFQLSTSIM